MKTAVLLGGLLLISSSLSAQSTDPPEESQLQEWELKVYPNPTSDLLMISSSLEIKWPGLEKPCYAKLVLFTP